MFPRLVIIGMLAVLLGQGCWAPPTSSFQPPSPLPSGDPSPDGPVAFREGFGKLPGMPPTHAGVSAGSVPVVFNAEVPELPPEVTVLREWTNAPNETLVKNITTALHVPSGALGRAPAGGRLDVSWKDGAGYAWRYSSASGTVAFERDDASFPEPLGTKTGDAVDVARTFFSRRGADVASWGPPYAQGIFVTFAASRDEQSAVLPDGQPQIAAALDADVTGDVALRGFFELPKNQDRSNYNALSAGEVLERLRGGGTHPVTNAGAGSSLVFDHLSIALYRHEPTVNGVPRVFYLPALWAQGTLHRADGALIPWATTVPLVKDDAFAEAE